MAQNTDHLASERVPMIRNPNVFGIQIVTVLTVGFIYLLFHLHLDGAEVGLGRVDL